MHVREFMHKDEHRLQLKSLDDANQEAWEETRNAWILLGYENVGKSKNLDRPDNNSLVVVIIFLE